jgi:hypothetical protein
MFNCFDVHELMFNCSDVHEVMFDCSDVYDVHELSSTVMWDVQFRGDFSCGAIWLAPSVEPNISYDQVVVDVFDRYSSSP